MLHRVSRREAVRRLKELGWKTRGKKSMHERLWYTEKQGLKLHTKHGLTFIEAASIEHLCLSGK